MITITKSIGKFFKGLAFIASFILTAPFSSQARVANVKDKTISKGVASSIVVNKRNQKKDKNVKKVVVEVKVEKQSVNKYTIAGVGVVAVSAVLLSALSSNDADESPTDVLVEEKLPKIPAPAVEAVKKRSEPRGRTSPSRIVDIATPKVSQSFKLQSIPSINKLGATSYEEIFKEKSYLKTKQPEIAEEVINKKQELSSSSNVKTLTPASIDQSEPKDSSTKSSEALVDVKKPVPKKNILSRLFERGGPKRSADIKEALGREDIYKDLRISFALIASKLMQNTGLFPQLILYKSSANYVKASSLTDDFDSSVNYLKILQRDLSVDDQTAAEIFAETINPMLVYLVDNAVTTLDNKNETYSVTAADSITELATVGSKLYDKLFPGVVIDAVVYNGKVRKGKLEDLFCRYLKSNNELGNLMNMALVESDPTAKASDSNQLNIEDKSLLVNVLQRVLGFNGKKRENLEGRVMRQLMMNGFGDLGGEGGLGNLMNMIQGKEGVGDGAGSMDDMAMFEEMMKSYSGADMGAGGSDPNMPDLSKLSPEEMQSMSREVVNELRSSIKAGTLTAQDIAEMEKVLGAPVEEIVAALSSSNVSSQQLKQTGLGESVDVMKDLAALKRRLQNK